MKSFLLLTAVLLAATLQAQTLDVAFHSPVPVRDAVIYAMIEQPDGKILMGGDIAFFGQQPVSCIIRLNPDGSLDNSFSFQYSADYWVMDMALHSSGDLLVLLRKSGYNEESIKSRLLRVQSDGVILHELEGVDWTNTIQVQSDGKVLAGGNETFMRYNENLTEDATFNDATSIPGFIRDILVVGDKIFVAGDFDNVNGEPKSDIVKLNIDGTIDETFDAGTGSDSGIGTLVFQPDGKILVGNTYVNQFNGVFRRGTLRLNVDGSVDETFQSTNRLSGPFNAPLYTDEGIYMAGWIHPGEDLSISIGALFRLKHDGSFDESFTPIPLKAGMDVSAILVDNKLLVNNVRSTERPYGIGKINYAGIFDDTYAPPLGSRGNIRFGSRQGNKFVVAGDFVRIDNTPTFGVARLNSNGTVDQSFLVNKDHDDVRQIKLLDNDKTLVRTTDDFFRLDVNGALDPLFNWPVGSVTQPVKFFVLDDDKILLNDYQKVVRYQENGTIDESFGFQPSHFNYGFDYDLQGQKIIVGGGFQGIDDEPEKSVLRITSSGAVDNTFDIGQGPVLNGGETDVPHISMVKVLRNNEVLLGGLISMFDGHVVKHNLVKLSADGEFNADFNDNQDLAPAPPPGTFFSPVIQQIGSKIFMRGVLGLFVLNVDGTVDEDFAIPATVSDVWDIIGIDGDEDNNGGRTSQENSSIVVLGNFKVSGSNATSSIIKVNFSDAVTGIPDESMGSMALTVYPQPTTGTLNVILPDERGPFNAVVYDASGTSVLQRSFEISRAKGTLDVTALSPGLYILKATSSSGKHAYARFVRVP